MKLVLKALTLGVLTFIAAGQFAAQAQGPGGYTPDPNRHMGTVTAVDTTANTITIHDRRADTDSTIKVTTDTKYTKQTRITLTDLAVGDIVQVNPPFGQGQPAPDPNATTIAAGSITTLLEMPATTAPNFFRGVTGTIVTTTPALTIKNAAGATITVTTDDTTRFSKTVSAALTDVAVGNNVMIMSKDDADKTDTDAVTVNIMPARGRRGGGPPAGGAPAAGVPAPAAVN